MRKIVSKNDRKQFYKISLMVVIGYAAMFGLSLTTSTLNYEISKYVNGVDLWKSISWILATIHTVLVIFNWIILKVQKARIEYVKSSKVAWFMGVIMDVLSTVCLVCNTMTSLINGNVVYTDATWLVPFMSFLVFIVSNINIAFAIYFLVVAKKAVKLNETL